MTVYVLEVNEPLLLWERVMDLGILVHKMSVVVGLVGNSSLHGHRDMSRIFPFSQIPFSTNTGVLTVSLSPFNCVCLYSLEPQVLTAAPYNPLLVFVGVPAIPALLVTLEGADLDGRWPLPLSVLGTVMLFIVTLHHSAYQIVNVWPLILSHPYRIFSCTNCAALSAYIIMYVDALCTIHCRGIAMWRREISPRLSEIPLVGELIETVWPTPMRVPYASSQGPESPVERLARSLSAGLLLPFAAYATGKTLFKWVKGTPKQVALVSGWHNMYIQVASVTCMPPCLYAI